MVSTNLAKAGVKPNNDKEYDGKKFLSVINGKNKHQIFPLSREDKARSSDLPWKEKTRLRMKLRQQSLVLSMPRYYPV